MPSHASWLLPAALLIIEPLHGQITWSNFAGGLGGPGSTDGPASEARFYQPLGIATDTVGNTYVADSQNDIIRKIAADGTVSTIAGFPGESGSADGPGPDARFSYPFDVAVDTDDSLLVADYSNDKIRKITPAGNVSTLAVFTDPRRIAIAPDGSLVVTGSAPSVSRISPSGTVSTIAGGTTAGTADGVGTAAGFGANPLGVCVDSAGIIYVADTSNFTIRRIDTAANVTTIAGIAGVRGTLDGPVATATLDSPAGIMIDSSGNLIFVEKVKHTVRKISPDGNVSTIAGISGVYGYADGTPETATFRFPYDLVAAPSGNILIADSNNHSIREILPTGEVTRLAGQASYGSYDGIGSAAKFEDPDGIAVDQQGNVFVSDRTNNTIRRITPAGVVTTIAGKAGVSGSTDGPGADARFNYPRGLAVDAAGNIFVSERLNHTIRKITPSGQVSTFAGFPLSSGSTDGIGSSARFNNPTDVVVDSSGVLYVTDFLGDRIRRISPDAAVTTYVFPTASGSAPFIPNSSTNSPIGLAINPERVLFAIEHNRNNVIRILPDNSLARIAGSDSYATGASDGLGTSASFRFPVGIAADARGNCYIADTNSHTIRKINSNGWVSTIGGTPERIGQGIGIGAAAHFNTPTSLAVGPDGAIYVANKFGNNIVKGVVTGPEIEVSSSMPLSPPVWIDSYGKRDFGTVNVGSQTTASFTIGNSGLATLTGIGASLTGVSASDFSIVTAPAPTIDPAGTSILAIRFSPSSTGTKSAVLHLSNTDADESDYTITLSGYATDATPTGSFCWNNHAGGMGSAGLTNGRLMDARFRSPGAIAVGLTGTLYIADTGNHVIRKVTSSGIVTTLAGQVSAAGSTNGQGAYARFTSPKAVAVDANENVYVADTGKHIIRKITPDGTVTTLAGLAGTSGSLDGSGNTARFKSPSGIAFDPVGGRLIVADYANHTLRAVSLDGNVSTIAGSPLVSGSVDGPASSARFYNPYGVAVDASGNIFVCDYSNHTIRILRNNGEVSTLAGQAATPGSVDGQGTAALLSNPSAITLAADDSAYFTDAGKHTVRKLSASGAVTTLGGDAGATSGAAEGIGNTARFTAPAGIAISVDGRLLVANTGKHHLFRSTVIGPDIAVVTQDFTAVRNQSVEFIEAPQQGTATRSFLITNAGSSALDDLAASELGPDVEHFGINGTIPTSLGPNETANLLAEFSPTSLGSKQGGIRLTSNDSDENPFDIIFQGTSLVLLDYWRKAHFSTIQNIGDAADSSDPDDDGIVNFVEYAFGTDPWNPAHGDAGSTPGWLPSVTVEAPRAMPRLRIEYLRRKASSLPGISYEVEFGSSLEGGGPDGWLPATATESVSPVDASWERVTIEDVAGEGLPMRFGRLRISPD